MPAKNVHAKAEARPAGPAHSPHRKVLLVGSPNVGKSMLFNRLTGRYVTVSNYPGTTVELSKGTADIAGHKYDIIDTPGMYSLLPITDEEKVASDLLLKAGADAVVHVIDAKNIQRMLGLTLQLIEASLPVVLVLNMSDEARQIGIHVDSAKLEELLQIPVVETVAISGKGITELLHRIHHVRPARPRQIDYGTAIENSISVIAERLQEDSNLSCRTRSLLLLQTDPQAMDTCPVFSKNIDIDFVKKTIRNCLSQLDHSVHYHLTWAIQEEVKSIVAGSVNLPDTSLIGFREKLSRFCMHPVAGLPILFVVLYFGVYKFVGGFGAGILVDFLESNIFEAHINPFVERITSDWISWQPLYDLIAGEYGIITLGIRYAIAIVLPIVGTFFIAFSILEDSGYLPRLAMLIDRLFKRLGLNGRAVIPIVLGFGCSTMATMVTRTLESRREKVIASILLALAIPCSAQFGVILGLLANHPYALLAWALFVSAAFVLAGALMERFFPGEKPSFYMELPPLRLPRLANVFIKTYSRMVWYFKEILPLFILASILIWLGELTDLFQWTQRMLTPVVNAIGLPDEASVAFIFGFFRRDYGAAGLYDLQKGGMMSGNQLAVAAITLTLFLPCIAQFLVFKKECGFRIAAITSVCICIIAFTVGFIANSMFNIFGLVL